MGSSGSGEWLKIRARIVSFTLSLLKTAAMAQMSNTTSCTGFNSRSDELILRCVFDRFVCITAERQKIDGVNLLAFIGEPLNSERRPFKGMGYGQVVEVSRIYFPSLVLLIDELIFHFVI